jgi:hypothetical protein
MSGENLQQVLQRLAEGRTPTQIAEESEGRLSLSTVHNHLTDRRGYPPRPSKEVIEAYADVLPAEVHELWDAVGVGLGLDLGDQRSALEQRMPPGVHRLDRYPLLVKALHGLIREAISTVTALERDGGSTGGSANGVADRSPERVPQPSGPTA